MTAEAQTAKTEIGAGLRAWYSSCRCCLSDAHPEIVTALDAERIRTGEPIAAPGICDIAEGKVVSSER